MWWSGVLDRIKYGQLDRCAATPLPRGHVTSVGAGSEPSASPHYFRVTVDGMRLAHDRVLNRTFDPLLLAVTEFVYAGKTQAVPFIVGPSLVKGADAGLPRGMVLENTTVCGPHPHYGSFAVTMILYRVERDDYVRRVLDVVQRACGAFDLSTTLSTYLKVGEALLDGVESLLGQKETEPVLGHRTEFQNGVPGETYLISQESLAPETLWLHGGALKQGKEKTSAEAVAKTDYIAYTVAEAPPVDIATLPWFAPLWARIVQWADIPNDEAKAVAKNYLAALYEEMVTSPDVARDESDALYEIWEKKAINIHRTARKRANWSSNDDLRLDPVHARALDIRSA